MDVEEKVDNKAALDKIIASDLPRGVALLGDLSSVLNNALVAATSFTDKIKSGEMDTSKGLSLLELKNQSFLSYLTNLTFVILRKLSGAKLEGDPSIERLVELRALLERARPLEDKLKYRIDKFVKVANEGTLSVSDPLRVQGNLDNIGSSSDEEEEEEGKKGDENDDKSKKEKKMLPSKAYKVPKIAPVHFDDESKEEAAERARRRALNSAVVRDALFEHVQEPEVIYNTAILKHKSIKKRKELDAFEEENFMRKILSKKEQADLNQVTTIGSMRNELLGLGNVDALQDGFMPGEPPSKRQKTGKAGKGKKKGKGKKVKGKKGFKKRNR